MNDETRDRLLSYDGHVDTRGIPNFASQNDVRLDEFVVTNPEMVHLEHLSDGSAYLAVYGADGHDMHFNVSAGKGGRLYVGLGWCEPTEEPT